jgi:exonuclease SbcD
VPERQAIAFEAVAEGRAEAVRSYGQRIETALESIWRGADPRQINILMAHAMVDGAYVGPNGGERALTVGETFALRPAVLPASAQYVALGHVHKPQVVSHPSNAAWYSGSLLQLDFGEAGQTKSVNLLEVAPGIPARGLGDAGPQVPIGAGRALRDLEVAIEDLPAAGDLAGDDWLRVTVRVPSPVRGLYEQVAAVLPNAVEVREVIEGAQPRAEAARSDQAGRDPAELFTEFVTLRQQAPPDDALLTAFRDLLRDDEVADATA